MDSRKSCLPHTAAAVIGWPAHYYVLSKMQLFMRKGHLRSRALPWERKSLLCPFSLLASIGFQRHFSFLKTFSGKNNHSLVLVWTWPVGRRENTAHHLVSGYWLFKEDTCTSVKLQASWWDCCCCYTTALILGYRKSSLGQRDGRFLKDQHICLFLSRLHCSQSNS